MWVHGRKSKVLVAVFALFFLFSCQTAPRTGKPAALQPAAKTMKKQPVIALVLGGGSAKGFAHVGVLRVLEQEKIPINMIIGTSVGSLIGGLYAANPDSFQLEVDRFQDRARGHTRFLHSLLEVGPCPGCTARGVP